MAGANPKATEYKPEYAEKLEQYKKLNEELRKFDKSQTHQGIGHLYRDDRAGAA